MSAKKKAPDKGAADKDAAEAPAEGGKKKLSGKVIVLFIVLPVLLLGGVGAGLFFSGILGGKKKEEAEHKEAPPPPKQSMFVDLPEMLVNLNTGTRQASYLKMRIALEVDDPEAIAKLEKVMPKVLDSFQVFLRELRADDLSGSAGLYRVKEELQVRIGGVLQPFPVKDVLFKEMLVQ